MVGLTVGLHKYCKIRYNDSVWFSLLSRHCTIITGKRKQTETFRGNGNCLQKTNRRIDKREQFLATQSVRGRLRYISPTYSLLPQERPRHICCFWNSRSISWEAEHWPRSFHCSAEYFVCGWSSIFSSQVLFWLFVQQTDTELAHSQGQHKWERLVKI